MVLYFGRRLVACGHSDRSGTENGEGEGIVYILGGLALGFGTH